MWGRESPGGCISPMGLRCSGPGKPQQAAALGGPNFTPRRLESRQAPTSWRRKLETLHKQMDRNAGGLKAWEIQRNGNCINPLFHAWAWKLLHKEGHSVVLFQFKSCLSSNEMQEHCFPFFWLHPFAWRLFPFGCRPGIPPPPPPLLFAFQNNSNTNIALPSTSSPVEPLEEWDAGCRSVPGYTAICTSALCTEDRGCLRGSSSGRVLKGGFSQAPWELIPEKEAHSLLRHAECG